ncbi:MAG: 30S ribosomal protein S17e [Candidatus Woesearchaeota archaeon]|nr:MAG: 30S ribosomal protein S17e [Candidatus Woesearchaeota archaeon]
MGRVRTSSVKRAAEELMLEFPNQFTKKFEENKKKVAELADVGTRKLRNMIAGYITKKVKSAK